MSEDKNTLVIGSADQLWQPKTRRDFMRLLGVGGSVVLLPAVFAACSDDDDDGISPENPLQLNLSNDTGILNYAYALEQLEAAFYTQVVAGFGGSNLSQAEKDVLTDIKNHEVIHREAFKVLLGNSRIPDLTVNFGTVKFAERSNNTSTGVLNVAKTFEDLGVAAYNGAGKYLDSADFLLVAGKIVSVEARHAAVIRDLLNPGSKDFAGDDVVDNNGLDRALEPSVVLDEQHAGPFIDTPYAISANPAD